MKDWDPEQYHRFRRYREEPFAHISERLRLPADTHVVDLGCGTGEQTLALLLRAPLGTASGLDASPAMIAKAQALTEAQPEAVRVRLTFALRDLRTWRAPSRYDLVFSNAALQWVDSQRPVLQRAFEALTPGGQLVIQMPRNHSAPSHRALQALAISPRFQPHLMAPLRPADPVATPEVYRGWLTEIGFTDVDVYDVVFQHPMTGPGDVLEWMKGTGLRPYLSALPEVQHGAFLSAYLDALASAYGAGPFDFAFRRVFLWARRS